MANTQEQMDSMLPAVDDDTRSTQEYLEDTKPMDISSVPAFQRPMDATTLFGMQILKFAYQILLHSLFLVCKF